MSGGKLNSKSRANLLKKKEACSCVLRQVSCGHEVLLWQEGPRASEVGQRLVCRVDMEFPSHSASQVAPPKDIPTYVSFGSTILFCFLISTNAREFGTICIKLNPSDWDD